MTGAQSATITSTDLAVKIESSSRFRGDTGDYFAEVAGRYGADLAGVAWIQACLLADLRKRLADRFGNAADTAHAARRAALRPSPHRDMELCGYGAMMRTAAVMLRPYKHTPASVAVHVTLWRDRAAGQVAELRGDGSRPAALEYWAQHGRMDACGEILSALDAEQFTQAGAAPKFAVTADVHDWRWTYTGITAGEAQHIAEALEASSGEHWTVTEISTAER